MVLIQAVARILLGKAGGQLPRSKIQMHKLTLTFDKPSDDSALRPGQSNEIGFNTGY